MVRWLAEKFTALGWSRDDAKWFWSQLVAGAGLVVTGALNVQAVGTYLGIHVSDTWLHWITGFCAAVLWLSGNMSTSHLFAEGKVPPPPKP